MWVDGRYHNMMILFHVPAILVFPVLKICANLSNKRIRKAPEESKESKKPASEYDVPADAP